MGSAARAAAGSGSSLKIYFKIQKELVMKDLEKQLDDPEILVKMASDPEFARQTVQNKWAEMNAILQPIALKVFNSHDIDNNGVLCAKESVIFFSQYTKGWKNMTKAIYQQQALLFGGKQVEAALLQAKEGGGDDKDENGEFDEKVRNRTRKLFKSIVKSAMAAADDLYASYLQNHKEVDKAAFEVIDVGKDGLLQREEVLQALEIGSETNKKLLEAFGLTEETLSQKSKWFMKHLWEDPEDDSVDDSATHPYIKKYFMKWNEIATEDFEEELDDEFKMRAKSDRKFKERRRQRNEAKINAILQPIVADAFDYHDTDKNGILSEEESANFFSHYAFEWKNLTKRRVHARFVLWEETLNKKNTDKAKLKKIITYSTAQIIDTLYADYLEKEEEHKKAAFEVVDVDKDGKLQLEEVLMALEIGSEKNEKLMEAFGIADEKISERLDSEIEMFQCFTSKADGEMDSKQLDRILKQFKAIENWKRRRGSNYFGSD